MIIQGGSQPGFNGLDKAAVAMGFLTFFSFSISFLLAAMWLNEIS